MKKNRKDLIIRLYYVAFEKFESQYYHPRKKIGQTHGISSRFRLPDGMSLTDACKVISFLSDKIEQKHKLEPACERSVALVSHILSKYGFEKIESPEKGHYHILSDYDFLKIDTDFHACNKIEGVIDLFSIGGSFNLFKRSDLSSRYFNWYTQGVTMQEVENIYKNIGLEDLFQDATHSETI